jgi:hypothetical protein
MGILSDFERVFRRGPSNESELTQLWLEKAMPNWQSATALRDVPEEYRPSPSTPDGRGRLGEAVHTRL